MSNLVIETKNLTKKYSDQVVANNVNLHIEHGKIYGLLGRNGVGKTTIMKMILGLTSVTAGEITVFGQKLKGNEKQIYPRIGAIIETPGFYPNLTGTENLKIFAKLRGMTRKDGVKHALDVVGLPYNDKKLFSKYSLGMKQRLGVANAIMHEPELLILDEPTNGLDPIGIAEVRKFIKNLCEEKGITLLISSHILTEIEQLADTIGIIHNGILLEEIRYKDLQKKNRKYILLKGPSSSKATRILEQKFSMFDYDVEDDMTIRIYEMNINTAEINKTLIINDVDVISLQLCNDTLEDYFKKITGGEGIA
ncbi:MAG: ATP-binding cassette domain-containing protein [Spirochaetes bacterium]|nr:ATP-binding cassette domain-containing protein [Spirochaetota bacterium]